MPDRRLKLLLDAIAAIDAAQLFIGSAALADYEADLQLRSAVERQLEILGEACARLSREHTTLFAELPATRLAVGLRNRIIHGDDAIDNETVYRTATEDLAGLSDALRAWLLVLDPLGPASGR
jgi:uncharacterized protein with HEPN domain